MAHTPVDDPIPMWVCATLMGFSGIYLCHEIEREIQEMLEEVTIVEIHYIPIKEGRFYKIFILIIFQSCMLGWGSAGTQGDGRHWIPWRWS